MPDNNKDFEVSLTDAIQAAQELDPFVKEGQWRKQTCHKSAGTILWTTNDLGLLYRNRGNLYPTRFYLMPRASESILQLSNSWAPGCYQDTKKHLAVLFLELNAA